MRPVTRSTNTHPPLCHNHRGVASSGKLSFMWKARRTTNSRSVISCGLPIVNSFSLPSTYSARTLSSIGVFSSAPVSHLTCVDLPNVITCGLAAAIAVPLKTIMLHSTRVVLVMHEAYYQSECETQGQRSQSVVRQMAASHFQ